MNLNKVKFTEEHAIEVTNWKYEGEYSIYNLPSWDEVLKNKFSFIIEDKKAEMTSVVKLNPKDMSGVITYEDGKKSYLSTENVSQ
ncbi:MAG: hypothetical protein RSD22_09350 [Romboutsia sp.]